MHGGAGGNVNTAMRSLKRLVDNEWRRENQMLKLRCRYNRMVLRNATPQDELVVERLRHRLQELAPLFAAAVTFRLGGQLGKRVPIPTMGDLAEQLDRIAENQDRVYSGLTYIEEILHAKLGPEDLRRLAENQRRSVDDYSEGDYYDYDER
jgi:hypothetical protein